MADEKKKQLEKLQTGFLGGAAEKVKEAIKKVTPFKGSSAEASQPSGQYENKKPRNYGGRY